MGRIVAIAGGDLDSIRKLNLHAIALTKKSYPNVLFIGTASRIRKAIYNLLPKNITGLGAKPKVCA